MSFLVGAILVIAHHRDRPSSVEYKGEYKIRPYDQFGVKPLNSLVPMPPPQKKGRGCFF